MKRQRLNARRKSFRRRFRFEALEKRQLLATITVDSLLDNRSDDGFVTLREAIDIANATAGADTITFDAGVFSGGAASLIRLGGSELEITDTLTIDGSTAADVLITGDASGNDTVVVGTFITDVAASLNDSATALDDNSRVLHFSGTTGDLTLHGLTVTGGRSISDSGGGILFNASSALTLTSSTISGNSTTGRSSINGGGGIYATTGDVNLTASTVSGNSVTGFYGYGGGIFTVTGDLTLTSSTVSGNTSGKNGGGIRTNSGDVNLTSSTVSGNASTHHGAGIATSTGALTLTSSTVSGNTSGSEGGGIFNVSGAVNVTSSTVSGNTSFRGGGIRAVYGDVNVTSSTISGNTSRFGGGIYKRDGNVTLTSSTVSGNVAQGTGGGVFVHSFTPPPTPPSITIVNSIVAGNTDRDTSPDLGHDPGSTLTINYSLIGATPLTIGGTGNRIGTLDIPINPELFSLADNDGPTQTHALRPMSPAINAGNPSFTSPPDFDQRGSGFPRVQLGRLDIGAFEVQVVGENTPPMVSPLSDVSVKRDTSATPLAFTIFDAETLPDQLTLAVTSSDQSLVQDSDIQVMGSGSSRVLLINPVAGAVGTTNVTVMATDPSGLTDASQFSFTLTPAGLTFEFTYRDVIVDNNIGFDDPVMGQARRNSLEAAARQFGGWFDHSANINVRVDPSSQDEGSFQLASAGQTHFVTRNPGFDNPGPLEIEVLRGIDNPGVVASLDVNFSNRNNFALGDTVGFNQQDFTALIMHELVHTLGFLSTILEDGRSELVNVPSSTAWSPVDEFIADAFGVSIIDSDTFLLDVDRWNASKTTDLTFNGPNAKAANNGNPVPLYTPGDFNIGDSVSHLDENASGISSLTHLMTSNNNPGPSARALHPVEQGILQDLGFRFASESAQNPTINDVDDQTILANQSTDVIPLSAFDAETVASGLTITATSSNPTLVPNAPANLALSGSDIQRGLTITPAANQSGSTTITLTVTDGDGLTATQDFVLNVTGVASGDLDFGDAPLGYPVTMTDNGARHTTGSLFLGASVDAETDGAHSSDATSDDNSGPDEDGVFVNTTFITTNVATTSSFAVIASEAGKFDAWIDFNNDGDWLDTDEQIFTSVDVVAGENLLSFTIPANASAGGTGARFRLSSTGGLAPTGAATDGEVEDYIADIVSGSNNATLEIDVPGGKLSATIVNDALVVSQGSVVLFQSPTDSFGAVNFFGTSIDDTFTLTNLESLVTQTLLFDGGLGHDVLNLMESGQTFDLTNPRTAVRDIEEIDIAGTGSNTLIISVDAVKAVSSTSDLLEIVASADDTIFFGSGWMIQTPRFVDGSFTHVIRETTTGGTAEVRIRNDRPQTNPLNPLDADRSGSIEVLDAFRIINELARGGEGPLSNPTNDSEIRATYFDVTGDNLLTANDALRVINALERLNQGGQAEALLQLPMVESETSSLELALRASPMIEVNHELIVAKASSSFPTTTPHVSSIDAIDVLMTELATDDEDEVHDGIDLLMTFT